MKRILVVLALAAAGAVSVTAAQAEVVTNDMQEVPFAVFVPCANDGAGEVVSGTIVLHSLTVVTTTGNNIFVKMLNQPQGGDLTGSVTGDKYQPTGVTQDQFKASLQNGQFEETFVNNFRIIGQGPGNNFLVHDTFHITANADGDVTIVHDNFSVDCK